MFVGKDVSKLRQCKDTFETAFEILSDMEISEETLFPEPGPWGGAGEAKKKS